MRRAAVLVAVARLTAACAVAQPERYGVIYSATFAVTRRHDPTEIILTATGPVTWLVQLWLGDYVVRPAPAPSI